MSNIILLDDGELDEKELDVFNSKYLVVMEAISNLAKHKKDIEKQEKELKKNLEKAFEEYEIKSIDNEFIKITKVDDGEDSKTINLKEFEKNEPDVYKDILKDYPKVIKGRKGYIKFTVK